MFDLRSSSMARLANVGDHQAKHEYLKSLRRSGKPLPTEQWPVCKTTRHKNKTHLLSSWRTIKGRPMQYSGPSLRTACGRYFHPNQAGCHFFMSWLYPREFKDREGEGLVCHWCLNSPHASWLKGSKVPMWKMRGNTWTFAFKPSDQWQNIFGFISEDDQRGTSLIGPKCWRRDELWYDPHFMAAQRAKDES